MLRTLLFKNLNNFKKKHHLIFNDRIPNIFIGEISSEKTNVSTLLQSCLSRDVNLAIQSLTDENQNGYVLGSIEVPPCYKTNFQNVKQLISGVIKTPKNKIVKLVWMDVGDSAKSILVLYAYGMENGRYNLINRKIVLGKTEIDGTAVSTIIQQILEEINVDENLDILVKGLLKATVNEPTEEELKTYGWILDGHSINDFFKAIDDQTILKDVGRSFVVSLQNPLDRNNMWTWRKETQAHNSSQSSSFQDDILNELLSCSNEELDQKKADRIFDTLMHPLKFSFKKTENDISVKDIKSEKVYNLSETPESVIAARKFSLMMALKDVHTICLEEPDRGMHPTVIEKMREILIKESIGKVLIVRTQSPYLISRSTSEFANIIHPTQNGKSSVVTSIQKLGCHLNDVDVMRKILFSSKVLFVKGKSEKIVIEGIQEHLNAFTNLTEETIDHITCRQIVVLGRNKCIKDVAKFCREANIAAAWVFHRDNCIKTDPNDKTKIAKIKLPLKQEKILEGFIGIDVNTFLEENFDKLSEELQKHQAFSWKLGSLEDTIRHALTPEELTAVFPSLAKQPLQGKETNEAAPNKNKNEKLKEKIKGMEYNDIRKLVQTLIAKQNTEFYRFVEFIREFY